MQAEDVNSLTIYSLQLSENGRMYGIITLTVMNNVLVLMGINMHITTYNLPITSEEWLFKSYEC